MSACTGDRAPDDHRSGGWLARHGSSGVGLRSARRDAAARSSIGSSVSSARGFAVRCEVRLLTPTTPAIKSAIATPPKTVLRALLTLASQRLRTGWALVA